MSVPCVYLTPAPPSLADLYDVHVSATSQRGFDAHFQMIAGPAFSRCFPGVLLSQILTLDHLSALVIAADHKFDAIRGWSKWLSIDQHRATRRNRFPVARFAGNRSVFHGGSFSFMTSPCPLPCGEGSRRSAATVRQTNHPPFPPCIFLRIPSSYRQANDCTRPL